jgi:flagellin
MAMNTHRQLGLGQASTSKSMEKLSSGYKINRAGDDAAGLAISEKMRGQIRGLGQASRNAQDAISLVQTAEGALNETQSILQRMRELSVQAATDTNVDVDRAALQAEMNELASEITRISETTEFNTQKLLTGDFKGTFHIGANEGQNMKLTIADMSAQALKVSGSGEGKATYDITVGDQSGLLNVTGLVSGEQTLNVVELDNVTLQTAEVANYGLSNDAGEIVAISTDGKTYSFLTEATKESDLAAASAVATNLAFGDAVVNGSVTLTATLNASNVTTDIANVTATASIDVEGLATGEYTVATFDSAVHLTDETFEEVTNTDSSKTNASEIIDSVLLNSNNEVVAVSFKNPGGTPVLSGGDVNNTKMFYSVKDIDFSTINATLGATRAASTINITTTIANVDAIMTKSTAYNAGETFTIKADGGIDISSQETASAAITTINNALDSVSAERSKLGATQNRLDHTIKNLDTSAENLQAAESRIRDVDMAKEMMEFTKNNILQQAAQAMLAQANQAPQGVLQLLR